MSAQIDQTADDVLCMGVDVGTTAVKAAVYTLNGRLCEQETHGIKTLRSQAGWSEQSMPEVRKTALTVMKNVAAKVPANRIASIGVCGQGDGLWLLDENKEPVRNAILWNDQRAGDYVSRWIDDGTADRVAGYCRTALWAGTTAAAFRWLKDNDADAAARARHVLYCKDWLNFTLTGNLVTDFTDASIPFLDLETKELAPETFEALGVAELYEKLPEIRSATEVHGRLLEPIASEIGLTNSIPVATGSIDVAAMLSGMGLEAVGDIGLILGTTAVVAALMKPEPFSEPLPGATLAHPYNNLWIRVLAPLCGAAALDWFSSTHPRSFGGDGPAAVAARMNAEAATVAPGANGVTFLPFLEGERAPFVAPEATASFLGMTSATMKADLARAVMEGGAFSLRHCFEATGVDSPRQIFLTGGGARNGLWCDIIASVMNTTIVASNASDHGLWGAARMGAVAADLLDLEASHRREDTLRRHRPDAAQAAVYDGLFDLYKKYTDFSVPQWEARRHAADMS